MMRTKVRIGTLGTVSRKKYPKGTYKVGGEWMIENGKFYIAPECQAGMLLSAGWTVAKNMRNGGYFYMTSPGNEYNKNPILVVDMPTLADIEGYAKNLHAGGVAIKGYFDGWLYEYRPAHTYQSQSRIISMNGPDREEVKTHYRKARFRAWGIVITWDVDGNIQRFSHHESTGRLDGEEWAGQ